MKLIRPCIGGAFLCLGYFVLVAAAPLHGVMKPIPEAVPRVAVIHLLFDDQVYNGMVVYVRGYLDSSRLEAILYPTREDALMQNEPLGISIEDLSVLHTKNTCSDRFVAVKGTFRIIKENGAHIIDNVKFIEAYDFSSEVTSLGFCYEAARKN